jgi:hypothetical protein
MGNLWLKRTLGTVAISTVRLSWCSISKDALVTRRVEQEGFLNLVSLILRLPVCSVAWRSS